ncbi:putative clathrin assembly protein [Carex littledalei]|uniref:Putative clathrin assembly protein n=1 Tax=Carex littledalei TaxID=544730 RepID=A0A833V539_9POAL|nr:putative clathrin assembly protein [Carex littledalei]
MGIFTTVLEKKANLLRHKVMPKLQSRLNPYRIHYRVDGEFQKKKKNKRTKDLDTMELLNQLPALQQLLHRLLNCMPQGAASYNVLIQHALTMISYLEFATPEVHDFYNYTPEWSEFVQLLSKLTLMAAQKKYNWYGLRRIWNRGSGGRRSSARRLTRTLARTSKLLVAAMIHEQALTIERKSFNARKNQDEMIKAGRLSEPYKGIGDCFERTMADLLL